MVAIAAIAEAGAESTRGMNAEVAVIGAVIAGIAALAGALINGLFLKRKLGAEATNLITNAATGLVERLEDENERITRSYLLISQRLEEVLETAEKADRELRENHRFTHLLERRVQELEAEQHAEEMARNKIETEWRRALDQHGRWDTLAVDMLRSAGIDVPHPPPAFPAPYANGEPAGYPVWTEESGDQL